MFLLLLIGIQGRASAGSLDSLFTRYQRGIHTDIWAAGWFVDQLLSPSTHARFSDAFSSTRMEVLPGVNKWKDQNQLNAEVLRRLNGNWSLQIQGASFVFSDKQTGYMNDIQTHFIGAGAVYQRPNRISVPVLIGLKSDQRYGRTDAGWSIRTALDVPSFQFSDYHSRLNLLLEGDDLRRRKNASLSLSSLFHRRFYTDTHDTLSFFLIRQRRDYYISEAGDVESWDESAQNAENILTYRLSGKWNLRIHGGLTGRTLRIRQITGTGKGLKRERKDFSASGQVRFAFQAASFFSDLGFGVSSEEQDYQIAKTALYSPYSGGAYAVAPDNQSAWTTLTLNTRWNASARDTLRVHSSLQKLQYDTPDPNNVDDRDDLRFWTNAQFVHSFSDRLFMRIGADVYSLHLVYLSGRKSADNNQTRIFRFYPSVIFTPSPGLKLVQTAEVLGNYVDYDFEDVIPGVRSFLYRKFRLDDSLGVRINSFTTASLSHRIELDENGKLVWDSWLEEKLLDRQSRTFSMEVSLSPVSGVTIAPGYTYYRRRGYRYRETMTSGKNENLSELTQDFLSRGPTLRMFCRTGKLLWSLQASVLEMHNLSMPMQRTTRADLNMNWRY